MTNPLYDIGLEETVLGAVMLEHSVFQSISADWDESVFHKPAHKTLAWAMDSMSKKGEPIDIVTITNFLKQHNKLEDMGGAYAITQLTHRVASTANTEYHFRILKQLHMLRQLRETGILLAQEVEGPAVDPFDLIYKYEQKLGGLTTGLVSMRVAHIAEINRKSIDRMLQVRKGGIKTGVTTGFESMDRFTGGWQNSDLVILAARPAMGKTSLAIAHALNAAKAGIPTAVFSLEMSSLQLMTKIQSIETLYSATELNRVTLMSDEIRSLQLSMEHVNSLPLFIDDTAGISILQLRQKARRLKSDHGIGLIIVDYLQLMTAAIKSTKREEEISYISRGLKALAKELDIPVIALSQLSRDVEKRQSKSKIPMLSDLRESGAIEQDADIVIFIYRPEYYGLETFDDDTDARGKAEIIYAKNRQGALGSTIVGFQGFRTRFFCPTKEAALENNPKPALQPNNEFL